MTTRRPLRLACLGLALCAVLTGCAGTGSPEQAPGGATASSPAPGESAQPAEPPRSATPSPSGETAPGDDAGSPRPDASAPALDDPAVEDPASPSVLVNKARPLDPLDWAPHDLVDVAGVQLRAEAAGAAEGMIAAAGADGVDFTLISGYRSYAEQERTYGSWVAAQGQESADNASARPGHSEHQTGLAADIGQRGGCDLQVCFAETDAADWVAEHAAEHGFIVRYPWWEHETTGYWYEPWHLRYVGAETARAYAASGAASYEEFLGAPAAPDYAA
ncbi:D-alanyl-D-alanine carboxypeptidase family protein [Rothia sp. AR01]|uniref:D-alanyl-D-alanine carboxypeptidase family protein n=1 Tax=Rothia santali TaxID=2949643 RepID=A0A9X2H8W7_9MICC|nr:D-alanyl-D-alanine carboxypeptidase family protein [Rothia santali]MCP3424896.1 D-alanyl-D-alanine carboxypeptidase family protein [Rothia santali]